MLRYFMAWESSEGEWQDRVCVCCQSDGLVIGLADGAGGMSGASNAAQIAAATCTSGLDQRLDEPELLERVPRVDEKLSADARCGQSTLVLLQVDRAGIRGASVGDSEVWLIEDDQIDVLTVHQQRKPLLGSSAALPMGFRRAVAGSSWLLMATDGLIKNTTREKILHSLLEGVSQTAADELIELVLLPSGQVQDDVTVCLVDLTCDE